jgi:hypothetical protein
LYDDRVLRRTFGLKRDEVTGGWRKLHNEELHDLYPSPSIFRIIKSRMRWTGHVARIEEKMKAYKLEIGKPQVKRSLGRPRHRRVDIKAAFAEIGWSGVDWIEVAQYRDKSRAVVNAVMNLRVP